LTPRERFRRIMAFEPVDRMPLIEVENYESKVVERWRTEGLPEGMSVGEHLGLDRLEAIYVDFWPLPRGQRQVLEEDETYVTVRDEVGIVTRYAREAPDYIYIHLEHPIQSRRDWEAVRERLDGRDPARYPADWVANHVPRYNASEDPVGLIIHPFFYRFGYYMIGTERFMMWFCDEPDLLHEIFAYLTDFTLDLIAGVVESVNLDYVAVAEDLAYKHSSFISPAMYREYWMPHQPRVIRHLKDHGVPLVSLWSSGDISPVLPQAIEAGFNATWPIESAVGLTPQGLRAQYGKQLALAGGMSIRGLIEGREAIRREVQEKVLPLWEEGGYIPTVDDMTPPEVPYDHYRYYIDLLKEIG
jgi:uroporphyrinogen-III decarboxylase